jgi:histidyl-tRNA synthetase
VIIGADELARSAVQLRDLGASAQREVNLAKLADELVAGRQD